MGSLVERHDLDMTNRPSIGRWKEFVRLGNHLQRVSNGAYESMSGSRNRKCRLSCPRTVFAREFAS